METPQIQTSFIPKQTLVKQGPAPRRLPTSLVTILALLILGFSVAALIFAYGYRATLLQQLNNDCPNASTKETRGCGLMATLERERANLDPNLLKRFRQVDAKTKIAEQILGKHATLVPLFALLNETTLQSVQYRKFSFSSTGVVVEGVAASYEDIALQSKEFAKHKEDILTFIFSDLVLEPNGGVAFKLQMTINPSILSYRDYWEKRPSGFEQLPAENNSAEDTSNQP